MRKSLVLLLALALAGCTCAGDEKKPAGGTATDQKPATQAPAAEQPEEKPAEQPPTELQLRQQRIEKSLDENEAKPTFSETLPRPLGDRPACKAEERRRYNLEGDEVYVIVGTFPNVDAAKACIADYQQFLGKFWEQFKSDFYLEDRFVIELNPKMTPDIKAKAKKAVSAALN